MKKLVLLLLLMISGCGYRTVAMRENRVYRCPKETWTFTIRVWNESKTRYHIVGVCIHVPSKEALSNPRTIEELETMLDHTRWPAHVTSFESHVNDVEVPPDADPT